MDNLKLSDDDLVALARRLGMVAKLNWGNARTALIAKSRNSDSNCFFVYDDLLPFARAAINLYLSHGNDSHWVEAGEYVEQYDRHWWGPEKHSQGLIST